MDASGARLLAARIAAGVRIGSRIELVADCETDLRAGDRGVVREIESGGDVARSSGSAASTARSTRGARRSARSPSRTAVAANVGGRCSGKGLAPRPARAQAATQAHTCARTPGASLDALGGLGEAGAVSPGSAGRRDAASSVASVSPDMDAPCVLASRRPAAPRRRGPFHQALLAAAEVERDTHVDRPPKTPPAVG